MSHRAHLFSLRIGSALRESCINEPYTRQRAFKDVLAGLTVGIIAIPLAMALAIASGVAPQYGLYTAIVAGFLVPLTGGSRYSISGPTAAFVIILYPVAQQYGLAGLLVASMAAGVILVAMALLRLGRLIEYIPEAVTLGFTTGIAIVIATLQVGDFFGLEIEEMPESYVAKVGVLLHQLPEFSGPSLTVAALTLLIMLLWPKLKTPVPPHLPAVVAGSLLAFGLTSFGWELDTIGTRFSYFLPDGTQGQGIPPFLPSFEWPWLQAGPKGETLHWEWQTVKDLLPAVFAIAMLGAIESLLCAVVLDGVTGRRHSANSELLGQGIGNIVTPFFGGITATAAIARSAANYRAGAESPVAGMVHALVVLAGLVLLAPLLSYLPMSAMAALLVVVAWGMSDAPKSVHLLKTAPKSDVLVFMVCMSLTVLLDMVVAISAGIVLASLLFMKEIAEMTKVTDISNNRKHVVNELTPGWRVYKVNGPLFFAAADRVFGELSTMVTSNEGIVLYMDGVPILDAGGLAALQRFLSLCEKSAIRVMVADLQFQPLKTIHRAGVQPIKDKLEFYPTLAEALETIFQMNDNQVPQSRPLQAGG